MKLSSQDHIFTAEPGVYYGGRIAGCLKCRAFQELDVYPSWHPQRGKLFVARERKCVCDLSQREVFPPETPEQTRARANGKAGGAKRMELDPGMALARRAKRQARNSAIREALAAGESPKEVAKRFHVTRPRISQIKAEAA